MATHTFRSVSEAVGYAAAVILGRGDIRKGGKPLGGPPPDEATALLVLRAMRSAGCPIDSAAGRQIVAWACSPDDVGEAVDSVARSCLSLVLEQAGLVPAPPKPVAVAWRVHRTLAGRAWVTCVADPDPRDPALLDAGSKAEALAAASERGLEVELLEQPGPRSPVERARADVLAWLAAGESGAECDRRAAAALGCSTRTALKRRLEWTRENLSAGC